MRRRRKNRLLIICLFFCVLDILVTLFSTLSLERESLSRERVTVVIRTVIDGCSTPFVVRQKVASSIDITMDVLLLTTPLLSTKIKCRGCRSQQTPYSQYRTDGYTYLFITVDAWQV